MKVRDCMCNNAVCCTPSTTVLEASKLMQTHHIGCIPICDSENCMIGIITDRDIVLRCIANNKDVKETTLSEIMTTNVCTCKEDDEIQDAQSKMGKDQIRRLPVVDNNGKVVGMLTLGDLAQNDIEIGQEEISDTINSICECDEESKNNE